MLPIILDLGVATLAYGSILFAQRALLIKSMLPIRRECCERPLIFVLFRVGRIRREQSIVGGVQDLLFRRPLA